MPPRDGAHSDEFDSSDERAAAARAKLHADLAARGKEELFYRLYPDLAPAGWRAERTRENLHGLNYRQDPNRDRER